MLKRLIGAAILASAFSTHAAMQLNNDTSRVNFVSVKKNTIAEAHHFKNVSGKLSNTGVLTVEIDLSSVETNIAIRNQRMQTMLFNTAKFAKASLNANIQKQLASVKLGQSKAFTSDATLKLHGIEKKITVSALVSKQSNGELVISSMMPIIINAKDFNLSSGIDALQKIAGLPSIAHGVPVSFVLHFAQ